MKKIVLILLSVHLFFSCGSSETKNEKVEIENKVVELPDSIQAERYCDYLNNLKNQFEFDFNDSLMAELEVFHDLKLIKSFIQSKPEGLLDQEFWDDEYLGVFEDRLYTIDLNGDELLDVVYYGFSGGEPMLTQIFINDNNVFKMVFSEMQHIISMEFKNKKLQSFVLLNPGCCSDPQILERHYRVSYKRNFPKIELKESFGYLSGGELPEKKFSQAKDFTIKTYNTKLRSEAYIIDNVELPTRGYIGNVIATFTTGLKGKALGMKKDGKREWIFAIMEPLKEKRLCEFPTFNEQPTKVRGWVLKSDITFE